MNDVNHFSKYKMTHRRIVMLMHLLAAHMLRILLLLSDTHELAAHSF